jgi:hypothetical protein
MRREIRNYLRVVDVRWGMERWRKAKQHLRTMGRFGVVSLRSDIHSYSRALLPDRVRIHAVHCERKALRGTHGRPIMLTLKDLIGRHGVTLIIDKYWNASHLCIDDAPIQQRVDIDAQWDSNTDVLSDALKILGIKHEIA